MMSDGLSGWFSHTQLESQVSQAMRCSTKKPATDFSGRAQITNLPYVGVIWFYCQGGWWRSAHHRLSAADCARLWVTVPIGLIFLFTIVTILHPSKS